MVLFQAEGGIRDYKVTGVQTCALPISLEERMEDVRAVMDAAGSEQAALIGVSEGGPMSMLFAATYPERTRGLLLIGAEVKEEITDDWPWGETTREEFEDWMLQVPERWGKGLAAPVLLPEEPDQEAAKAWLGKLQTASATPGDAVAVMRVGLAIDVRDIVPASHVPTLILHPVDDGVCHVENARFLAANIEG